MKNLLPFLTMIVIAAGCSQPDQPVTSSTENETATMAENDGKGRVTGIGGIFFKCEDTENMKQWYYDQLGLAPNDYGSLFEFREGSDPEKIGYLQWSPFGNKTKYFEPSKAEFMINYRVKNIEALVEQMKEAGVTICDSIEEYEYGKFVHILDPENNKIELWEPVDEVFTKLNEGKPTTK